MADGLYPFTLSHTARTISFGAIGIINKIEIIKKGFKPDIPNKPAAGIITPPKRPQAEIYRVTILD